MYSEVIGGKRIDEKASIFSCFRIIHNVFIGRHGKQFI